MHCFGCVTTTCKCFGGVSVTISWVLLFVRGLSIIVYEGVANNSGWLVGWMLYHVVSPYFQSMDAMYRVTGFGIYDG